MDTLAECKDKCVYQKKGVAGSRFCFRNGGMTKPVCVDNPAADCRCGMKKPTNRIVGGEDSVDGDYPWMAFIAFANETGDIVSICGGSVINSKWIITARHCLFINFIAEPMFPTSRVEVLLGWHDDIAGKLENRKNAFKVKEIVPSPTQWDDYALIKVDGEIDTAVHTPICLPKQGEDFRTMDAVLTGWGYATAGNVPGNPLTDILQEVTLPIASAEQCNQFYKSTFNLPEDSVIEHSLCIGGEEGKSACGGDNGGPLIVQKKDHESWTLAGVFNGIEEPCGKKGNYGHAVNIANFVDFIKTTTADGTFCN